MANTTVERYKRRLAGRIAKVRGDRSQRQFARELGVFQQNVNRYENGTTPHTDFLITLATKERVSVDWLHSTVIAVFVFISPVLFFLLIINSGLLAAVGFALFGMIVIGAYQHFVVRLQVRSLPDHE